MFSKQTSQFEKYLNAAKELADEINKLEQSCINLVLQFQVNNEVQQIFFESEKKLKDELLKQTPLALSAEQQQEIVQKTREESLNLHFENLTKLRDLQFDNITRVYAKLKSLSSLAQSYIVDTIKLKDDAHNRDVLIRSGHLTNKTSNITDSNLYELLKALLKDYEVLNQRANQIQFGTLMAFMFTPTDKTPEEFKRLCYRQRAAMYKDTEAYKCFKEFSESLEGSEGFKSLKQYLETNTQERHLSKELLKQITTFQTLVTGNEKLTIEAIKVTAEIIESAREQDFQAFLKQNKLAPF
ncbi:magnesium transporter CorA family protein [Legionella hackeliae]|uniref:Uncharacterized protein n=1 Tax=Legionella hackeliae TaxID=449 RepID=A0A0A8UWA3_LEGHA|nr:hypothetical protein [Legionella hackeliae]KTD09876.1 hypothetical protein Lhac_2244 [Legionella hackeliae]CEK11826.1 protein of unknown function [Legionella hackeliae]STX48593.1 Uncharacterised protein [Legionella hackeliae]